MKYYIVMGPIDGLYHVGYYVPGTKVYSSMQTSRSIGVATLIAEEMNDFLESKICRTSLQGGE